MRSLGGATRAGACALAAGLMGAAALAPAQADVELTPGSAVGTATVAELNIPYGGANIGVALGTSTATYFEGDAKASAVVLEPSFLRIAGVLKVCGGELVVTIPPATAADSAASGSETNRKELGPGLGVEQASASAGSHGRSAVTAGAFGIPGVVEVWGGEAETDARLDGDVRTVRGEVRTGAVSLAGGLVELRGMRWMAGQTATGPDSRDLEVVSEPAFSIGSVTLGGVPLPASTPAELAGTVSSLNGVLAPIGIQLRLPEVRPNGDRGVQITPLTVALGGSPAYGPTLYPLIAGPESTSLVNLFNSITQPAILEPRNCDTLFGLLKAVSPEANTLLNTLGTYGPVVLSAAAAAINGGAELNLNIGGVRTTYDATYYPPRTIVSTPASTGSGEARASSPSRSPGSPSAPMELASRPTQVSTSCATTSPVGRPGCWKGSGPLAATLAALVTFGLLGTDEVLRRRRRPIPIEEKP